jgi:uncharacterized protein (TIGR03437 family)
MRWTAVCTVVLLLCLIAPAVFGQTPIPCGQVIYGSIKTSGQTDFYAMGILAGDAVTIRLSATSGSLYGHLELYGPAGNTIQATNSGRIDGSLATAGLYTLVVSDQYGRYAGDYALVWQRLNNPCGPALGCGQQQFSSISKPGKVDFYTLASNAGDVITIRLSATSGSLYGYLELYAPAGNRLQAVSSGRIDASLPATGLYTVVVSDQYGDYTGNYSLIWQRLNDPRNAPSIPCGQQQFNSIGTSGEVDFYTLAGSAGDVITIRLSATSGSLYGYLELFSPAGKSLAATSSGQISATLTTAGTHTLVVSDQYGRYTGNYSLIWQKLNGPCTAPSFTVSPAGLSFSAPAGLPAAAPAQLQLRSSFLGLPWQATVRTSSGGNWLSASPVAELMPATVSVSADAANLAAGTYQGTIEISAPAASPSTATVAVSFAVGSSRPASLSVQPSGISFRALAGGSAPPAQSLRIENAGSGALNWRALAATFSGNWLAISRDAGTGPADVQVTVNTAGLAAGSYSGTVVVLSDNNQSATVPVSLLVSRAGGTLLISQTNLLFRAVEGGGAEPPQTFGVLNIGSGALDWTAQATESWLRISPASGRSDAGLAQIPLITVSVDPAGLAAGLEVGLIRVTSAAADNSPQVVRVDLQVLAAGTKLGAVVRPTGLIFLAAAGGSPTAPQTVTVATTQTGPLQFISQPIGGDWVSRTPDTGTAARGAPGSISVQAKPGTLGTGVYRAGLTAMTLDDGELYPVSLLFVVLPAGTAVAPAAGTHGVARTTEIGSACTPSKLLLQFTALFAQFNAAAGWPAALLLNMRDDCGNPAAGGTVVLSFSNGDPALTLADLKNGQYQGIWRPNNLGSQVVITARGLWGGMQGQTTATAQVGANPNPQAAILSQGGVVLGAGFERGPVAPGSIISLFGRNLAARENFASSLPLPRTLEKVRVLIGGKEAPLFYVGPWQVNAQVPLDLEADRQLQALVETNGVPSAPEPLQTAGNRPGIFTLGGSFGSQGAILIANTNFLAMPATANVPSQPARVGGAISIFCTGLGPTQPAVASGEPGPVGTLATVKTPVTLTVGDQPARVLFAGLAPGLVGVYQVNAEVPAGIAPGNGVPVVITQGTFRSNTATIAVR